MKYAVIKTGGRQYRVSEGEVLEVEKLVVEPKKSVDFSEVLLLVNDDTVLVGQPLVPNARVTAEVLEQFKGPKIRVAKFKAKTNYRRVRGHRQELTRIKITKIITGEKESAEKSVKPIRKPRQTTENDR